MNREKWIDFRETITESFSHEEFNNKDNPCCKYDYLKNLITEAAEKFSTPPKGNARNTQKNAVAQHLGGMMNATPLTKREKAPLRNSDKIPIQ